MTADFDPYFKWLAIPPEEQPPNHYRLLGVPLFTDDPDVIENAADQRTRHIRSFQTGQRSALSQQILNEISAAKLCLLDPAKRAAYDAELRTEQSISQSADLSSAAPLAQQDEQARPLGSATPGVSVGVTAPTQATQKKRQTKRRNPQIELIKIVVGGVVGLALGYLIVCWISPQADVLGLMSDQTDDPVTSEDGDSSTRERPEKSRPGTNRNEPKSKSPMKPIRVAPADSDSLSKSPPVGSEKPDPPTGVATEKPKPTIPKESKEERLALLTAERDAALANGNVESALKAVEGIAELDGSDVLERKAEVITTLRETADSPMDFKVVAERLLPVVDQAISKMRKDVAERQVAEALLAARKSSDADLVRRATLSVLKVQQMGSLQGKMPNETSTASQPKSIRELAETFEEDGNGNPISIRVDGVELAEQHLTQISMFRSLTDLAIINTNLDDAGLQKLASLANLTWLGVWNTQITSDGLREVGTLTALRYLGAAGNKRITDDGLAHLSSLKKLSRLDIGWTGITDEGMSHLAELPSLKFLSIRHTNLTDQALVDLQRIKSLKKLDVLGTKMTEAGIDKFKLALPDCEVIR